MIFFRQLLTSQKTFNNESLINTFIYIIYDVCALKILVIRANLWQLMRF